MSHSGRILNLWSECTVGDLQLTLPRCILTAPVYPLLPPGWPDQWMPGSELLRSTASCTPSAAPGHATSSSAPCWRRGSPSTSSASHVTSGVRKGKERLVRWNLKWHHSVHYESSHRLKPTDCIKRLNYKQWQILWVLRSCSSQNKGIVSTHVTCEVVCWTHFSHLAK